MSNLAIHFPPSRIAPSQVVHPALPIVCLSGKNERERSVTEVGREGGRGGERVDGGKGEGRGTKKTYSAGG